MQDVSSVTVQVENQSYTEDLADNSAKKNIVWKGQQIKLVRDNELRVFFFNYFPIYDVLLYYQWDTLAEFNHMTWIQEGVVIE